MTKDEERTEGERDAFADCIIECLKKMPRLERAAFILHRFERWDFSRIAYRHRTTTEAVEKAFSMAMLKLHECCTAVHGADQGGADAGSTEAPDA